LIQEQIRLQARARGMRDEVMRTLEDMIDGDELAIGGLGFATTLGDVHAAIVSAICADRFPKSAGDALAKAIRKTVGDMLAAGDFTRIANGWRHILGGENWRTRDHLAKIAGYDLRFSAGRNSISGLIRHHWHVTPSAHTRDPAVASDDGDIPDWIVRDRQAALARRHGLPKEDEDRIRILTSIVGGWNEVTRGTRPVPRLSHAAGDCIYVVEGCHATLHASSGLGPRTWSQHVPSSVMLHAPSNRFEDIMAADPQNVGMPDWAPDTSDHLVDVVRKVEALEPDWSTSSIETWYGPNRLDVRIDHPVADLDTLHMLPGMLHVVVDGSSRQAQWIKTRMETRNEEIATLRAKVGRPPVEGGQVPIDAYTIDVPLVKALAATRPDVRRAVMDIVEAEVLWRRLVQDARRASNDRAVQVDAVRPVHPGTDLIETYGIEFASGRIKARFDLGEGVRWDGGTLLAKKTSFPDVVLTALAEQPVERMVDHPHLSGLMIKRVKVGLKGSRADIVKPARLLKDCPPA